MFPNAILSKEFWEDQFNIQTYLSAGEEDRREKEREEQVERKGRGWGREILGEEKEKEKKLT